MAEWSACRTRNPAVPGSSLAFKSSATFVSSQLLWLRPFEVLNNVTFDLKYLFQLFARPH